MLHGQRLTKYIVDRSNTIYKNNGAKTIREANPVEGNPLSSKTKTVILHKDNLPKHNYTEDPNLRVR